MKKQGMLAIIFTLAIMLLAGCGLAGQRLEVINDTSYTFCKVEQTPNLSVYAPWQKRTKHIRLRPGEKISLSGGDKKHILYLETCDGHYGVSNYDRWPDPGEPWIIDEGILWDRTKKYVPKPKPTRTPAVVTIKNGTEKDICSIELSLRKKPYKFSPSILDDILQDGAQIVLYEPQDIKYSTNVLKITFCDGNEYITQQVTFSDIITITLRGEEQDTRDLLVEREKAK